ncbi:stage II sporulation protein M [Leucothrix sargassi]|nr:stage II sporulation protein M [Leucothrix sargassi]
MSSSRQEQFTQRHEQLWHDFEAQLDYQALPHLKRRKVEKPTEIDLPTAYRQICQHYALANSRMYSPILVNQLNSLVVRGHQTLYSSHNNFFRSIITFFAAEFPSLVRREWQLMAIASALFYVPFIGIIILTQFTPELVFNIMSVEQANMMESMYNPENSAIGRERGSGSDIEMFGHYIRNNTGIGFQVFAGGMLYGIGTLFFLLFNGIYIGAAAGHLTHLGYIDTFWGFVLGHGSFELTAIVISGAAGLKLAQALIAPGRKSRTRALIDNGKVAIKIMYGAATLFLLAAFVEAFWSSMPLAAGIKYGVAAVLWTLVIAYFWRVGRGFQHAA